MLCDNAHICRFLFELQPLKSALGSTLGSKSFLSCCCFVGVCRRSQSRCKSLSSERLRTLSGFLSMRLVLIFVLCSCAKAIAQRVTGAV